MNMTKTRLKTRLFGDSLILTNKTTTAIKNIGSIILAIIAALIVAVLIATASGQNPGTLISDLFTKAFIDWKSLIVNISVLGIGALAFIFAYKIGLFNIGISGQMLAAGLSCLVVAHFMSQAQINVPIVLSQVLMILIAIFTAVLVGALISILKIYLKVNEVVSSILINWIIFFVTRFIITNVNGLASEGQITSSVDFPPEFTLDSNGYGWVAALVILMVLSLVCFFVLKYTVFGTKMIGIGKSLNAAKFIGYNTNAYLIISFCISSAFSGILGYVLYTASNVHNIPVSLSVDAVPVEGMNGIAIGLIAMSHPIGILPVSFIIGLFQTSSQYLVTGAAAFSNLIIGFLILGAALVSVFMKFKPWIWFKKFTVCRNFETNYQKYINEMDRCISKYKSLIYDASQFAKYYNKDEAKLLEVLNNDKQQISYFSSFNDINELFLEIENQYIKERIEIKAQFKKRNLVDRASEVFYYRLEIKKQIEETNHEIDISKLKFDKKILEQIYDLENQTKLLNKIKNLESTIELLDSNIEKSNFDMNQVDDRIKKLQITIQKLKLQIEDNKEKYKDKASYLQNKKENYDAQFEQLRETLVKKLENKLVKHVSVSNTKLSKTYDWAMKQVRNIELDEKEKSVVIKWIEQSYSQAMDEFRSFTNGPEEKDFTVIERKLLTDSSSNNLDKEGN